MSLSKRYTSSLKIDYAGMPHSNQEALIKHTTEKMDETDSDYEIDLTMELPEQEVNEYENESATAIFEIKKYPG